MAGPAAGIILLVLSWWTGAGSLRAGQLEAFREQRGTSIFHRTTFRMAGGEIVSLRFALDSGDVESAYALTPDPDAVNEALNARNEELVAAANRQLEVISSELQEQSFDLLEQRAREIVGTGPMSMTITENDGAIIFEAAADGRFTRDEAARLDARMKEALEEMNDYSLWLQKNIGTLLASESALAGLEIEQRNAALRKKLFTAGLLREGGTVNGKRVVRIDYGAAVRCSVEAMRPVSRALSEFGGTERYRLGVALSFIQSIPYDTLDSRDVETGMGFLLPAAAIDLNRGDCDTKSVALAAILRSLLPERRCLVVVCRRHALLAVDLPVAAGDRFLEHRGRRFVLLEPAGPGLLAVGEVDKDSLRAIDGGGIEQLIEP